MFDAISRVFGFLVYEPQLNLLYFLYQITGDIGVSIIVLGIIVNLILWPVIVQSYISGQKMKIMGPKVKQIQAKYKTNKNDDPATSMKKVRTMQAEVKAFYKKHDIKTGIFFKVLFLQIFFASGVYYVVRSVSNSISKGEPVSGLYEWLFGINSFEFPREAFGFLEIDASSTTYIFLPIASLVLSYLYGMYSFKWAPNVKLPEIKKPKNDKDDLLGGIDPAAIQKNQEFLIIYALPVFTFMINASFSAGLNLYFVTLSLFNLIRHIIITQFYAGHVGKLMQDIANSDPESGDKNSEYEDFPAPVDMDMATDQAVAVEIIKPVEKK